jgi:hypothetical protein
METSSTLRSTLPRSGSTSAMVSMSSPHHSMRMAFSRS